MIQSNMAGTGMTKEAHNVSCYQQGRTAYAEYKDSLKGQVY